MGGRTVVERSVQIINVAIKRIRCRVAVLGPTAVRCLLGEDVVGNADGLRSFGAIVRVAWRIGKGPWHLRMTETGGAGRR